MSAYNTVIKETDNAAKKKGFFFGFNKDYFGVTWGRIYWYAHPAQKLVQPICCISIRNNKKLNKITPEMAGSRVGFFFICPITQRISRMVPNTIGSNNGATSEKEYSIKDLCEFIEGYEPFVNPE